MMNKADVARFEKIQTQIKGLYDEMVALTKKNPDDAVNKFKLKLVNEVLAQANEFLGELYRPFGDFTTFNEDDLPTNSDVAVVLSQYLNCLEKLRADNVKADFGFWYWVIDGKRSGIRTAPPKRIKD